MIEDEHGRVLLSGENLQQYAVVTGRFCPVKLEFQMNF
jgi:hypothetical protein